MKEHWGTTLRMARYELNLTQKEVAQIIGITDKTLADYEKGKVIYPKISNILSLCMLYKIDIKKIINQISNTEYQYGDS